MQGSIMKKHGRCWAVAVSVAAAFLMISRPAPADVGSDRAAAILVFPKLLVDSSSGLDTFVRISNTSDEAQNMMCFYVNVTPHCVGGSSTEKCFPEPNTCSGQCVPQWQETDFIVRLTARQPSGWLVSDGAVDCQFLGGACSHDPGVSCQRDATCQDLESDSRCVFPPCFRLDGFFRKGPGGQTNEGSRVPPAPEEPFIGELKCVAVDESGAPVAHNVLKGEVLIGRIDNPSAPTLADVQSYNAIGIPAVSPGNRDSTLVLGGPNPEYAGCPNILILNHFFDGAADPLVVPSETVRIGTDLTLVPCTEDFRTQNPELSQTVAQFLVFNEFEQRFSTSRTVDCFKESRLSSLDTPQNERSIFSAGVAGTLTGQTRIRGVVDGGDDHGNTLLGVAEEYRCRGDKTKFPLCSFANPTDLLSSAATNLHFQGTRPERDFIYLP